MRSVRIWFRFWIIFKFHRPLFLAKAPAQTLLLVSLSNIRRVFTVSFSFIQQQRRPVSWKWWKTNWTIGNWFIKEWIQTLRLISFGIDSDEFVLFFFAFFSLDDERCASRFLLQEAAKVWNETDRFSGKFLPLGLWRWSLARGKYSRILRETLSETNSKKFGLVHGFFSQVRNRIDTNHSSSTRLFFFISSRTNLVDKLDRLT